MSQYIFPVSKYDLILEVSMSDQKHQHNNFANHPI